MGFGSNDLSFLMPTIDTSSTMANDPESWPDDEETPYAIVATVDRTSPLPPVIPAEIKAATGRKRASNWLATNIVLHSNPIFRWLLRFMPRGDLC